ncbi:MAG: hypothetical protein ACE5Q3_13980 [Alphaproteobacteria bacterium]
MVTSFATARALRLGLVGALLTAAPFGFGTETQRLSNAVALAKSGGVLTTAYGTVEDAAGSGTKPRDADAAAEGPKDGQWRARRDISGVVTVDAPAETDPVGGGIRAGSLDNLNAAHASIEAATRPSLNVRIGEIHKYLSALEATPEEGIAGVHEASPADRDGLQDAAEAITAAGEYVDPVANAIARLLLHAVTPEGEGPGTVQGDTSGARIRPVKGAPQQGPEIE